MKAMVREQYGSPEVLRLQEVTKPSPARGEVLVKVHAASVNAGDWHLLRGSPFIIRLMGFGLLRPKARILGADLAGRVEALGVGVDRLRVGDLVFGDISRSGFGAFAEYVCAREEELVSKPTSLPFDAAATVPTASMTALQALRDYGGLRAGQSVLINGASGGVGTFAVQIAKTRGARVTGVCSTKSVELVRSLGVDRVIDYTQEDFTRGDEQFDLIVDIAASRPVHACKGVLRPGGCYVVVGGAASSFFQALLLGPWLSRATGRRFVGFELKPSAADLGVIRDLIVAGKIKPISTRRFPLHELPQAITYLEHGHPQGKIVIDVEPAPTLGGKETVRCL